MPRDDSAATDSWHPMTENLHGYVHRIDSNARPMHASRHDVPRGKIVKRGSSRNSCNPRPGTNTMVTDEYQATSSIAADINVAQNAGSIIDRPSRRFHHCLHFGQSGRGQFHGTLDVSVSRWLFPKLYRYFSLSLVLALLHGFLFSFFLLTHPFFLSERYAL